MISRLISLTTILFLLFTAAAAGQTSEVAAVPETTSVELAAVPPAGGGELKPEPEVLRNLERLLGAHPTELSTILTLDPSLLASSEFLARYPELAALVEQYPQLARNPRLYIDRASLPAPQRVRTASMDLVEGLAMFGTTLIFLLATMWLIRTVIEQRRWSRLARVQSEVHGKILDRFTSGEDLLRYIQSPAGARFLESAPIPVSAQTRPSGSDNSLLWSLQAGIVIASGSIGLLLVSGRFDEAAPQVSAMGVIGLSIGIGFAASAILSSVLSKRFSLMQPPATTRPGTE